MEKSIYTIIYNGKVIGAVNFMFLQQCDAAHNLELIKEAFIEKHKLYLQMKTTRSKAKLIELAEEAHCLEFIIQDLYGFPMNTDFHRFWTMPHCSCPVMDNEDNYGSGFAVTSGECKIHGK